MDFVLGLSKTAKGNGSILVIVDRLAKSAHFLSMKINHPIEKMAKIYVDEIVKLYGIPSSIVSNRDSRFTLKFWTGLENAFGTKLKLSSAYHPQTDGQTERTIQSLEDFLRSCVL